MPDRLPASARKLISDPGNELIFSAASLWEIAIKSGLGRRDFRVNAGALRRGLLNNSYSELPVTSEHALGLESLPSIHKDPFDRILISQANIEGLILLTVDPLVAEYGDAVRKF